MKQSGDEGLRAGEEQALGAIYDEYSPRLYRYAYRLLGEAGAAEEVVAETFFRWLQAESTQRGPPAHLAAYLYRIAHNLAVDHWRRRQNAAEALDEASEVLATDDLAATDDAQDRARTRLALMQLTPDQRQVIMLKYFESMTNTEVAQVIGKPEGAVKSLQHRALAALRRILDVEIELAL